MSRLTRLPRGATDRGAVAPLVAVLLAGGVLLGMAAWVVDLGVIYAERDQVLNAAGAAALAAAEHCVQPGPQPCGSDAALQRVADANASDGQMSIDTLCGSEVGTGRLDACPVETGGAATHCLTPHPTGVSWVEVHTGTRTGDGRTVLPPIFAGGSGSHVAGCARVAWGPPQGPYPAIGVSTCAFDALTGGIGEAKGFQAPPPYAPGPGVEVVLQPEVSPDPLVDGRPDNCDDLVYYQSDGDSCLITAGQNSTRDGWVDVAGHPAVAPDGCDALLRRKEAAADAQPYLLMPIYSSYRKDKVAADGETTFTIDGIAAFRVTGHKFTGDDPVEDTLQPKLDPNDYCGPGTTKASHCIRGYFVWADIIDGTMPAGGWVRSYGVATYKTVG